MTRVRRAVEVRGVVQGVGFRPFVARLADERGLAGEVGNDEVSVFLEVEGPEQAVADLLRALRDEAPPMAAVVDVTVRDVAPRGESGFRIVSSRHRPGARVLVPPDVAVCDDCLRELNDPADRRYRHPFVTCTNCGPRFSIITDLPYDRPATTMAQFPMCHACESEYDDPRDRRHHAQPISCHDCGPRLWWEDAGEPAGPVLGDDHVLARAQAGLAAGRIVAVKGIGGFHLACDATEQDAVLRLRDRKHRPDKPFAVMARDLDVVRRIAHLSPAAERALRQPARPIVLLPARTGSGVADAVAPGLAEIGVMLPYAPLHHLLFAPVPGGAQPPDLLVMTSGNRSDEPLCFENDEARSRLATIADGFLMHDRPIAVPCEDSVVTLLEDGNGDETEVPVRRSRGFAPLPVPLPSALDDGPVTLAVGAEVKNTFCLVQGDLAFCSAHVGDMGSLESQAAFARSVDQLERLRGAVPSLLVADLHPGYATRHWAEDRSAATGKPLHLVQHHHAHVVSLLADRGRIGTPVIGVAFDGTGYGCDRQVWGGEVLLVGPDVATFRRAGHLLPLDLPGGDAAVRNPFRVALALLRGAGLEEEHGSWTPVGVPAAELVAVRSQLAAGIGCVATTSVGRLFDGVAAVLGVRHRVSYEAQAAVELEALAATASDAGPELALPVIDTGADWQLDWRPLVVDLVTAVEAGVGPASIALAFHRALARGTADLVQRVAAATGTGVVGLTGGVFGNRRLTVDLGGRLSAAGLEVLTHRRVPPNDGGLCVGQAVVARAAARTRPAEAAGESASDEEEEVI